MIYEAIHSEDSHSLQNAIIPFPACNYKQPDFDTVPQLFAIISLVSFSKLLEMIGFITDLPLYLQRYFETGISPHVYESRVYSH